MLRKALNTSCKTSLSLLSKDQRTNKEYKHKHSNMQKRRTHTIRKSSPMIQSTQDCKFELISQALYI